MVGPCYLVLRSQNGREVEDDTTEVVRLRGLDLGRPRYLLWVCRGIDPSPSPLRIVSEL